MRTSCAVAILTLIACQHGRADESTSTPKATPPEPAAPQVAFEHPRLHARVPHRADPSREHPLHEHDADEHAERPRGRRVVRRADLADRLQRDADGRAEQHERDDRGGERLRLP